MHYVCLVCLLWTQSDQLSDLHRSLLSEQQRITVLKGDLKAKSAVVAELVRAAVVVVHDGI